MRAPPAGSNVILCAIDAAFLLAVAKPGQSIAEHRRALLANPRPSGLHFAPEQHTVWTDDSGSLALGVWQGGFGSPTEPGERWFVTDQGIVASIGSLRWSGEPWSPEASWARQLSAALDRTSLRDLTHDLRGVFSIVTLTNSGYGGVASDPLGFNFVYYGDNREVAAVSSRAALCARLLADEATRPARDHLAACWPAYSRHWIGERSGFSGVRLVRPGTVIKISPREPPSIDVDRTPWMPAHDLCDLTRVELFELAYEELADTIRSTLSLPCDLHRADLTGGKDTRLLASVVLGEGLADRFRFQTFGPPGLPDVRVAIGLARRFGLEHEVRFEPPSYSGTFDERMRSFVATTGGMANLWYQRARHDRWPEVRMSGTHGLLLRSKNRVDEHAESDVDLVRGLDKMRFGAAGVLQPHVARELRDECVRDLLDPRVPGPPMDRFDAFDLRASQRHLFGALGDLETDMRITPLTSARLVQMAYALGGTARISELIHVELMRRYSDELASFPFAQEKWRRPPSDLILDPVPRDAGPPGPRVDGKAQLVETLQVSVFAERSEALRDVLGETQNPAWDYVDRSATISALDRFADLHPWQRIELFGAATAAIWCGEHLDV